MRAYEQDEIPESQRIIALEGAEASPSLTLGGMPLTGPLAFAWSVSLSAQTSNRCLQISLLGRPRCYKAFCAEPKLFQFLPPTAGSLQAETCPQSSQTDQSMQFKPHLGYYNYPC